MAITIEEFFESKKQLCIHCKTNEQSIKLLFEFARLGYHWINGESYLNYNTWIYLKEDTIYTNQGTYDDIHSAKKKKYKIYEFEDIVFEISQKEEKPTLTDEEKIILQSIDKQYKYIARDADGSLNVYEVKPSKDIIDFWIPSVRTYKEFPFTDLFQFIKSTDIEPYNIKDLLEE